VNVGLLHRISPFLARSAASNGAEQCPLCPDTSDFNLLTDGKRVIDLDSEISSMARLNIANSRARFSI
jgi:hypothetical protein